ncbi:UDP-N-acetylglucosamine 1-carboxyvinyltransferase [Candidatus Woesebacteria bacterium]|nr:UDP-N-acetylglucosamine 1-carboxyvinyltransferase [Candidatus Woesebacteria bacterium]
MPTFTISGGTPLFGSVRVGGAKNASYKLMIASLLADSPSRILNFSHISDVGLVASIINTLGASAQVAGERAYVIDPKGFSSWQIGAENGEISRASTLFIPAMLAKFKKAHVPVPGGDKIGTRPLERHFEGLEALGCRVSQSNGFIDVETDGLVGTTYRFDKNTHTGTETMLMAAVTAKGTTTLKNAAEETEIDDLIAFLCQMGAKIERKPNRVIVIEGVPTLHGAIHKIMPDQNQVVSFACGALATKGDIVVENATPGDIESFLEKLEEIGAGYEVGNYGIRFFYKGPLKATNVTTAIHPGFKTDWQPLWVTLMTQAEGESILHETVYENRFQYVAELQTMGAAIELFNPTIAHPEDVYNFNVTTETLEKPHAVRIKGPSALHAGTFNVKDLRHGATLMMAAMCADGITTLLDPTSQIDRGYEFLDKQLTGMGATITRNP